MAVKELTLRKTLAENLKQVLKLSGLTHNEFAAKAQISTGALTNYLKGDSAGRTPPVLTLLNICTMPELKARGINLEISDLVSSDFRPIVDELHIDSSDVKHQDFIGVYNCYFFDQTKSISDDLASTRELRFGVIAVFDEIDKLTQEITMTCYAKFFKSDERRKADALHEDLYEVFAESKEALKENEENEDFDFDLATEFDLRNSQIRDIFENHTGFYSGEVTFSETHTFFNFNSPVFHDNALMVFYAPPKRADHKYIGGIGTVSSITHGSNHMPVAQKIILSSNPLDCSDEEIAEHLCISTGSVPLGSEAAALSMICNKLYDPKERLHFLDDDDKKSIIAERMNKLINNYIRKNINSVSCVSLEDDKKVYQLIRRFEPKE